MNIKHEYYYNNHEHDEWMMNKINDDLFHNAGCLFICEAAIYLQCNSNGRSAPSLDFSIDTRRFLQPRSFLAAFAAHNSEVRRLCQSRRFSERRSPSITVARRIVRKAATIKRAPWHSSERKYCRNRPLQHEQSRFPRNNVTRVIHIMQSRVI